MSFSKAPTDRLPIAAQPRIAQNNTNNTEVNSFQNRRAHATRRCVQTHARREQTYQQEQTDGHQRRDGTPVGGESTLVLGTDREATPRSTQNDFYQKSDSQSAAAEASCHHRVVPPSRFHEHGPGGQSTLDFGSNFYPADSEISFEERKKTPVSSAHAVHRTFTRQETKGMTRSPRFVAQPGTHSVVAHREGNSEGNSGTPPTPQRVRNTGEVTPGRRENESKTTLHRAGDTAAVHTRGARVNKSTTPPTSGRKMVTTPRHMCPPGGNSTICLGTDNGRMDKTAKQKAGTHGVSEFYSTELDLTSSTQCGDFDDIPGNNNGYRACFSPAVPPPKLDKAYAACALTRGTPPGGCTSISLG